MLTAAILPVKSFGRAKQRLGVSLSTDQREALAQAMVADVLHELSRCDAIARTIVVSAEPWAREAALALGATVLADEAELGQSAAVALGVEHALAEGFARVLCVPGDCPWLDAGELAALLADEALGAVPVVVIPDRHGSGTNGLLLCPPDAIAPSFGPGSRERHLELACARGHAHEAREVPSLLLDIDTGADLAVLRERLAGLGERARRTRAALAEPIFAGAVPADAA